MWFCHLNELNDLLNANTFPKGYEIERSTQLENGIPSFLVANGNLLFVYFKLII